MLGALRRRLQQPGGDVTGAGFASCILLGLFGRTVVTGAVGQQRDTGAFYYPLTEWLARELAAGRFPLWCPLIFAGYPIVADGEIGMLYPPNIVALLILPVDVAFILMRAGHYLLASVGTYALSRALGVGRLGSVFGGVTFALGGFMFGHLDHGNIVRSAAWLPLTLCAAERSISADNSRRRMLWIALGAATVTMAGLGSHPQIVLIELVALGVYVCARVMMSLTWQPTWRSTVVRAGRQVGIGCLTVAGVSILGVAGAAIQLVPMHELGGESSRGGGLSYAQAAAGGLHPLDLVTMVLPYGFRADPAVQWMRYPYWESTVWIGVVGIFLVPMGLMRGRRRVTITLALLALAGGTLAMADRAPLDVYRWLWQLPGFSSMRAPIRYTLILELALALLAGIGLDQLRPAIPARRARLATVALIGLLAASVAGLTALRAWVVANEAASLQAITDLYLSLPHDRSSLTAAAVRSGILATLTLWNPWTSLALGVAIGFSVLLTAWVWSRAHQRLLSWTVAGLGVAELLVVAHGFHPTIGLETLRDASRPLRFLSEQPGLGRALLLGTTDTAVTSRPALVGVAQAYGYSSLPTARMERYWTRVNEVGDGLLDLWSVRFLVEPRRSLGGAVTSGVIGDPARPLLDGSAGSPLGVATFRIAPTRADTLRLLGSLNDATALGHGETVAEVILSGGGGPPVRLAVRAGEHLSDASYDQLSPRPAHAKAQVGTVWTPRDPAGNVYRLDISLADIPLPSSRLVELIEVRTTMRTGALRLTGLGLLDTQANRIQSVLPSHRASYRMVYEDDLTTIYENAAAFSRVFLASRAITVPEDDWALVHLTDRPIDPRHTVLLERPAGASAGPESTHDSVPLGRDESAEIIRSSTDTVVVRVRATAPRYLVMTDTYFPGWTATLDDEPAPIHRANYLFRAVAVPPGEHVVQWRYMPNSLQIGASVSVLALGVAAALGYYGCRRPSLKSAARCGSLQCGDGGQRWRVRRSGFLHRCRRGTWLVRSRRSECQAGASTDPEAVRCLAGNAGNGREISTLGRPPTAESQRKVSSSAR